VVGEQAFTRMGCVASKLDINDVHPNMFAVNNVDDMGVKLNSGQLEITEIELVLHRRGKQPVKWPLRYLKRYGFEEGLFSFEAGRKNPTGPGIYSFKCRRAENLFNLLQIRVRDQVPNSDPVNVARPQVGNQDVIHANSSPTEESLSPRVQPSMPHSSARTSLADFSTTEPATEDPTAPVSSSYINVTIPSNVSPPRLPPLHPAANAPRYSDITKERPNTSGQEEVEEESQRHAYENVGPLQSPGGYLPPRHLFALPPKPAFRNKIPSSTSDTSEQMDIGPSPPESPCITENSINYIVLDLDNSVPAPTSMLNPNTYSKDTVKTAVAGPKGAGYVTIDFDKTDALIKSANQRFFEDDDPGVRKTRHNSSLSDLGVATKQNNKVD